FEGLDAPARDLDAPLAAGYLGSLNFAKLHPHYVDFLTAVTIPGFTVRMIGDTTNQCVLQDQCRRAGQPELLEFRGYRTDIADELAAINIFPYLLNPHHYGTSENALLEAMAMGVVPVVLDNPAERCLVKDQETGLVVQTRDDFAAAISWLERHSSERQRLSRRATETVLKRFDISRTVAEFSQWYTTISTTDKAEIPFTSIFGHTPAEWFLANQRSPELFTDIQHLGTIDDNILHGLLEKTKGSVFHYSRYFPEDVRLVQWARRLETYAQHKQKS
ncbi:MAG: glycosyltransferase family 4 protein, partial [Actinobacteria bacterium]|nr:glycosyltransferase family 4 protein [Actinomycetota bacterium]